MAPDKPITGNKIANALAAPLDKIRDRFDGRSVG